MLDWSIKQVKFLYTKPGKPTLQEGIFFPTPKEASLSGSYVETIQNLKVKSNTFPEHYKQVSKNYSASLR